MVKTVKIFYLRQAIHSRRVDTGQLSGGVRRQGGQVPRRLGTAGEGGRLVAGRCGQTDGLPHWKSRLSDRLLRHTVVVKELRLDGICRLEVGWSEGVSSCQLRHSSSVVQRAVALFQVREVGRGEDFAHLFISMEKATRADGWPGPGHSCIADSSAGSGPAWSSLTAARQLEHP